MQHEKFKKLKKIKYSFLICGETGLYNKRSKRKRLVIRDIEYRLQYCVHFIGCTLS